ncbi:lysozyme D-like [Drosophila nasuta]|uniref:lysozyme D-like n=1 Tax=Drosophila nasuta TaxID=42062 RepID=UPI00295F2102|nr:lysozyme D-like [Drosophila nasuta]
MKTFIVLVVLALAATAFGRNMDRCSLARDISDLGVPRDQLARWTCIAENVILGKQGSSAREGCDGSLPSIDDCF